MTKINPIGHGWPLTFQIDRSYWIPINILKHIFLRNHIAIKSPYGFVWFDSLRPINNLSVKQGRVLLGWTSSKLGLMCLAQGPQGSDAGEAWTRNPLVLSQALYHWATALPSLLMVKELKF